MKTMAYTTIAIGAICLILGLISRLTFTPIVFAGGIAPRTFLALANTSFLIAITFILLEILKVKQ